MRRGLILALAAVLLLVLGGALTARLWAPATVAKTSIDGPFTLVDANGRQVTEKSLLGKPTAIFFGFTFCPEVCPTTLTEMSAALDALGPDADRLNVVFVSVDPERDTPAKMKLYLSNFDRRIQGFTGTVQTVAAAAKAYRIYYAKVPIDGGDYTIDHSSSVYLFDRRGRFIEPIAYGAPVLSG